MRSKEHILYCSTAILNSIQSLSSETIELLDLFCFCAYYYNDWCLTDPHLLHGCLCHPLPVFLVLDNDESPVLDIAGGRCIPSRIEDNSQNFCWDILDRE